MRTKKVTKLVGVATQIRYSSSRVLGSELSITMSFPISTKKQFKAITERLKEGWRAEANFSPLGDVHIIYERMKRP